ncbi:MAG: hypothetical protein J2P15_08060 [Micromonosporaceae bacterium]|nr:hypothetical protein [Micromonosporaceae bacterium]
MVTLGLAMMAVGLVAAGALVGCGSRNREPGIATVAGASAAGSARPAPTVSEDRQQQAVDFARCMRAHGVDVPDPDPGSGGISIQIQGGGDRSKVQAARQACQHYLPNGGEPPSLNPQQLENLRKFAQCMRQHGVNVADPDPANPAIRLPDGLSPNDPAFQAAQQACRSALGGAPLMMQGGGPADGKGGNG